MDYFENQNKKEIFLGIDVGSVSLKLALTGQVSCDVLKQIQHKLNYSCSLFYIKGKPFLVSEYIRIKGQPILQTIEHIKKINESLDGLAITGIGFTGSTGKYIASELNYPFTNEFKTVAKAILNIYHDVHTIFEMGGENSKYIKLDPKTCGIIDYASSGDCAAGTGSFIDQQASRLKYNVEDIGDIALTSQKNTRIAGRCSVFAKSDMIHAQQKGAMPADVLKGLCEAVGRNFKGSITKAKKITPKVAFIGGVSKNKAIVKTFKEIFNINDKDLIIPEFPHAIGAIGACLIETESKNHKEIKNILTYKFPKLNLPTYEPLCTKQVVLLRDRIKQYQFNEEKIEAFLGLDIGSVSTNFVVIDKEGNLIKEIYTETKGRPIEVVSDGLIEIEKEIGSKIVIKGVGTTGSGRELIGELIGADIVNDEITAHKTGSTFIDNKYVFEGVDTIFEIGGQDSKFISLNNGIVTDFTMNEACAAGTGSFLEEQAEKLGINIKEEFSRLALSSNSPIRLGERCTVFMEQDVNNYVKKGASLKDICAGLAYSVALNYINRVVRSRKIGAKIYFQGGTAYNDSVAAAFSTLLNKKIIVPPFNGVIGAYGIALLSKEFIFKTNNETRFRGFNISNTEYKMKTFTCNSCENKCDIQEFNIDNRKTYWGDKCSVKYRKAQKTNLRPIIPNLMKTREDLLGEVFLNNKEKLQAPTIGFPRTMYFYEQFPFWSRFFTSLGFNIELSSNTTKNIVDKGVELTVSSPCFPIKVAHGHINELIEKNVDYIFLPNIVNAETKDLAVQSHFCVWGQTLPFVIKNVPKFKEIKEKILTPTIHYRYGKELLTNTLSRFMWEHFKINNKDVKEAIDRAYASQNYFKIKCIQEGKKALLQICLSNREGIVLVGRPYNVNDYGVNINLPQKLQDYYGLNVIPMDMLPFEDMTISDINNNMFWNYGYKILQIARFINNYPNLHMIYITNFKCGPDSYVKQFAQDINLKPFLILQFDEHSLDAGVMTRCEAYLDSKGITRTWNLKKDKAA
jgi:predicted CoA-substrate-specific enzyme activase